MRNTTILRFDRPGREGEVATMPIKPENWFGDCGNQLMEIGEGQFRF